jgi:hypothetical protein
LTLMSNFDFLTPSAFRDSSGCLIFILVPTPKRKRTFHSEYVETAHDPRFKQYVLREHCVQKLESAKLLVDVQRYCVFRASVI